MLHPSPGTAMADLPSLTIHDRQGTPFQVREYRPADGLALQRFYEAFEPKRDAQGLPPADPVRIRNWLATVLGGGIHLVAMQDGALVGHAMVMPTGREGIGEYAVFLRQDLRGRGLGSELNRAVAARAREAGLRGLWLTVDPRNRAAVRSYENAGFRVRPETAYSLETEMELGWPG
jgi:ribosomal protein S18 acetylase RimI-like enzyme